MLWEAIDARDGSGRDRVYEERLCFAAFSLCKAFTFTAQGRGRAGRCFMPTSGVRLPSYEAAAVDTRYANLKIVLPARLMGYVLRWRGRHAQSAFVRT